MFETLSPSEQLELVEELEQARDNLAFVIDCLSHIASLTRNPGYWNAYLVDQLKSHLDHDSGLMNTYDATIQDLIEEIQKEEYINPDAEPDEDDELEPVDDFSVNPDR